MLQGALRLLLSSHMLLSSHGATSMTSPTTSSPMPVHARDPGYIVDAFENKFNYAHDHGYVRYTFRYKSHYARGSGRSRLPLFLPFRSTP